jgi:methionine sulfoxide reductase heme-binding subunit
MARMTAPPVGVIIYALSVLLTAAIHVTSPHTVPVFHETQWYAGLAITFLYVALLIRPLYVAFPRLPYEAGAVKSQQALGVSGFYFALLHSYFGFFGFVGGFQGLHYWSDYFAGSLLCGLLALCLLAIAAATSIPSLLRRMGSYWKPMQRSIYVAGVLVLVHGVTVTIHLVRVRAILMAAYPLVLFLLGLEILRVDRYATDRYRALPERLVTLICLPLVSVLLFWSLFFLDHHTH